MACCCEINCQDCCGSNCTADPTLQGKKCNQIAIRVRMDIQSPGDIHVDVPLAPDPNAGDGSSTATSSGLSRTFDCVTTTAQCVFLPVGSLGDTGLLYVGDLEWGSGGVNCDNGDFFLTQINALFRIIVLNNRTYRIEAQHTVDLAGFRTVERNPGNPRFPFYPPGFGIVTGKHRGLS